jgi:hypothetical protein
MPLPYPAADTTFDPMLVEAAIQDHDQPSDHRSASEPGHADMVTIVVDDRPSDV